MFIENVESGQRNASNSERVVRNEIPSASKKLKEGFFFIFMIVRINFIHRK